VSLRDTVVFSGEGCCSLISGRGDPLASTLELWRHESAARTENFARVDARDLPELLVKMDDYNGDAITRFGLKLMSYTFVRTSELIEAPWEEFDLNNAAWVIPAERMKMGTPHIVPLARQSVEVLRALKLLTGNGRLAFPGANNKNKPISNNTLLYALYRLGYLCR
jgi:integrase